MLVIILVGIGLDCVFVLVWSHDRASDLHEVELVVAMLLLLFLPESEVRL